MIYLILSAYARQMEQYMESFLQQPEGLVEVGSISAQGEVEPCKIMISMLNIERETANGVAPGKGATSGHSSAVSAPPVFANLNILIASVFSDKRYRDSLSYLSLVITFVQANPCFTTSDGTKYTVELMAPSLQDQSNIWAQFGGKYYPSVVCKIRRLIFDSNEIKKIEIGIKNINSNVGI